VSLAVLPRFYRSGVVFHATAGQAWRARGLPQM